MWENGLTLFGMFAAVIAILALAYWATKWIATRGVGISNPGDPGAAFCVLRQITVGRAERLLLVKLGERCLLLGVTANSVTLLKELDGEEAASWLSPKEPSEPGPSFLEIFKQNLKK